MDFDWTYIKNHLRLDTDEDSAYIYQLHQTAVEYVENITGITEDHPKRFKHCVMILLTHWYESRELVTEGTPKNIPYSFQSLLHSLRDGSDLI